MTFCSYCEADVDMRCAKCGATKTGLRCPKCGSFGFGICPRCQKTLFPS